MTHPISHDRLDLGPVFCLLFLVLFSGSVKGQNGLREIPDTRVEAQLGGFKLPEGAEINLFAAEPLLTKPVHMNWDSKGRLWVVSSPLYPHIKPGQEEIDQLIVLEDTDGDGAADKSTVFADDLHIPTAVLPGDGGVYVANSTEMLFLKDTDGDGKADLRRVVLSGFGTEDTHHLIHTFRWGPEGMIWMNQSIYIHTHLETPYGIRRLLGGGMWHFRPETQRAEVFMKGLINPWGHVFDEWGQSFMTDGAGSDGINFVFPRSVFRTSPGASRTLRGLNPGQPKHCGAEVLSGNHLPEDYRGTIAAPDFRGHRINRFRLTENGTSGYQSTQVEDLVSNTHRAFRPIDIKMGPDGAIYIADWYNPIIQHGEVDFRDERRDHEHGRIWRISFKGRALDQRVDFEKASEEELARLSGPVGWNQQMATVELKKRDPEKALAGIQAAWGNRDAAREDRLDDAHLVMASQAINRFQADWAVELAGEAPDPRTRAAALRSIYYSAAEIEGAKAVAEKAVSDPHPRVRLWGVSLLAQLDDPDTVQIGLRALDGIEAPDDFLDFAVWSLCREHQDRWISLAETKNPFENPGQLLFAARAAGTRTGSGPILQALAEGAFASPQELTNLVDWVGRTGSPGELNTLWNKALASDTSEAGKAIILEGLSSASKLRRVRPSENPAAIITFLESENAQLLRIAATLSGQWKIEEARPVLETVFRGSDGNRSNAALEGLRALGGPKTAQFLQKLARDEKAPSGQRTRAVLGLARMNPAAAAQIAASLLRDPAHAELAPGLFAGFLANNRSTAQLAKVLGADGFTIPEPVALIGLQKASSAATKPQDLIAAIQKAGNLKPMKMALTPEEMSAMMQAVAQKGDPHRGETVYRKTGLQCLICHAIGGSGGIVGPDLVSIGSSAPVDYLIDSLLEPSKKIKEGYHTTLITMKNGDTFAGAVAREDRNELVIRDVAGQENRLAKNQIQTKQVSPVSLMPPGLTLQLRQDEFVDLVRFLSELGKEGEFKMTPKPFVRNWEVLLPHERTRDAIGHYGKKIFAEEFKTYQWTPFYAKVNGGVPLTEMPEVKGRGRNRYGVARFFVTTASATEMKLRIEGKSNDLNLFVGEDEVPLPRDSKTSEVSLKLKPGQNRITVSGLRGWGLDEMRVEILDSGGAELVP